MEECPLDLPPMETIRHRSASGGLHIERVHHFHTDRLHRRVTDVEPDLGERLRDPVQHPDLAHTVHLDHRRIRRRPIVEHHPRRTRRPSLRRPASVMSRIVTF